MTPGLGRAQLPAVDGAWHFKQEATNWALAEPALPIDADISKPVLSDSQLQQWMEDGYVVVHGMWPQQLIDSAAGQLQATLDAGEEHCFVAWNYPGDRKRVVFPPPRALLPGAPD